ncbi:MAG: IS1634 family transposase [Anaerolineae bacterium]|jgi:transposase
MAEVEIHTERVDDVPLLVHKQRQMGIPTVMDEVFEPHGNRQGLSLGWLTCLWLSFVLSEADHRMVEVEPWAARQRQTLSYLSPQPVTEKDFTDDRLADVLGALSQDQAWQEVEARLGQRLVRVYNLKRESVRLDSTTVAVYHNEEGTTLFRQGHSKDHRPDLAQFKVMLAALDPLGMPLATLVVSGNVADDPLYEPALRQARSVVGQGGRLYIGDSKMAALQTRAFMQEGGDYYLTALPQTGDVPELLESLLQSVWQKKQALEPVSTTPAGEAPKLQFLGYETPRALQTEYKGVLLSWLERVLVVFSVALAKKQRRGLERRLQRAEDQLLALTPPRGRGRRQWQELAPLQDAIQAILKRRRVEGLLNVSCHREVDRRQVRRYGDRPSRTEERVRYVVQVRRNTEAIRMSRRKMGWRLYVTNAPTKRLPLAEALQAYRGAPTIERDFRRLKGKPLGIRPLYVQRDDHAKGMVRLLSLALRVLTLMEHVVREKLEQAGESLTGLYAGLPTRETTRPTTERLLRAFKEITLTMVHMPDQRIRHITPLNALQRRILNLLDLPPSVYQELTWPQEANPP